jgi:hypothetical protein
LVIFILLALTLFNVSCTQGVSSTPATVPTLAEASTATATLLPPTPTLPQTPPPPPTATTTLTPSPSLTATPLPVQASNEAWCLPEHGVFPADLAENPKNHPVDALVADWTDTVVQVRNLPSNGCVFLYYFNAPAQEGMTLEVTDKSGSSPFLVAEMATSSTDPSLAYAVLRHTMIAAPPLWNVSYTFTLKSSSGTEIRSDLVNLHRWVPQLCWNGRPPNVYTLRCPLAQDLHPWDPSYGTPFPTGIPEED